MISTGRYPFLSKSYYSYDFWLLQLQVSSIGFNDLSSVFWAKPLRISEDRGPAAQWRLRIPLAGAGWRQTPPRAAAQHA